MSNSAAKERAVAVVVAALNRVGVVGDPDQLYDYAEAAVDALATAFAPDPESGWLITGGNVHQVQAASVEVRKSDRLGWYVHTRVEQGGRDV